MAVPYIDFYSGLEGGTCSYTAQFITKHAAAAKAAGMSEADYSSHLVKGHWGVVIGKHYDGSLAEGTVLMRALGKETSILFKGKRARAVYKNGQVEWTILGQDGKVTYQKLMSLQDYEAQYLAGNGSSVWNMRVPTAPRTPSVPMGSTSVGSLTDEDAAILFVKTKDDFAKAKGVNIKGANPQLDAEVYDSLAKITGYTPAEIKAKIEAYKASGHKLSALKKKVLSGKAQVKTPDPVKTPSTPLVTKAPDPNQSPSTSTTSTPSQPATAPVWQQTATPQVGGLETKKVTKFGEDQWDTTYNGWKAGSVKQGTDAISSPGVSYSYATKKVWKATLYDENGNWIGTFNYKTKQTAQEIVDNHAKKKFDGKPPKVQPAPVHTSPSAPAVQQAVKDLKSKDAQSALLYKEEDIVKAYIKAKDAVAADPSNQFTLYSKGKEFDLLIRMEMDKLNIVLKQADIDAAIASYLGAGNKLSVLKKKMISSGEMKKQAPSLKQTKAQQAHSTPPTASATQAQAQVQAMSQSATQPVGSVAKVWNSTQEDQIFNDLKNGIYAAMSEASAWEKFEQVALQWRKTLGEDRISALDIMRVYDKKKAAQLGIPNGNFYENKVATWASSPSGQQYMIQKKAQIEAAAKAAQAAADKAAKQAALENQINDGIPDLPADSVNYQVIPEAKAREIQNRMAPWTADQKDGLRHYTGGSFREMNSYLRGGTSYVSTTNRIAINTAQMGMRAVDEEFLVRRGCSYSQFGIGKSGGWGFDIDNHLEFKSRIGQVVEDQGFLSTSVGGEGAFGGSVKVEVEVTKGTYGAYVDHISQHRGEREFMVARGTKYRVLRVEKVGNQTVIRVRTIPGSHSTQMH